MNYIFWHCKVGCSFSIINLCVCKVIVVIYFLSCVCLLLHFYKVQFEHVPRKKRKKDMRCTYVCGANPFFDLFVSLHSYKFWQIWRLKRKSDAEHKQIEAAIDSRTEMHAMQTALAESDAKIGSFAKV